MAQLNTDPEFVANRAAEEAERQRRAAELSRAEEGFARALAVPDAKFGWEQLKELYRGEPNEAARDGLAVALAAIADDELVGDLIDLARDQRFGDSRLLLLRALEKSRDPRARAALMDLGTDPALAKEIQVILRRVKRRRED